MINITRDASHPWSGEPGWDRMVIQAETNARVPELIAAGQRKHWRLFFCSGKEVLMYKPAGATDDWSDKDQWLGCDREAARALSVGDTVFTNYSNQVTRHTITDRQPDFEPGAAPRGQLRKVQVSQTGVLVKVKPDVPGSGGGWMDPAWFRKVEQ